MKRNWKVELRDFAAASRAFSICVGAVLLFMLGQWITEWIKSLISA
jgi:hypothetical protein